ncbi:MAG: hypothetical protein KBS63_05290 [Clostridiales bacterium]|nr:hypothetical protein [Candidatus Crickella caballi]
MKFSDRFDTLMNIAEVSNSMLGRDVHLSPSYIGRLRSGSRPLPKSHDYIRPICRYLVNHIRKDYQRDALCQLIQIDSDTFKYPEIVIAQLEKWILGADAGTSDTADRILSMLSRLEADQPSPSANINSSIPPLESGPLFYGNEGKRKAVEQFFLSVLQEESPQTLLLFSDENMAWLYEDERFTARWTDLFTRIIAAGNRVRIIHTISRDINEMIEAVSKWLPIYMTGMVEPYFYPRLRDGIYQRTLFIAPKTAAVTSDSVSHDTSEMLNLFLTDPSAIHALCVEFERYMSICRPMMQIFSEKDFPAFRHRFEQICTSEGDVFFCCATPPAATMPEKLIPVLFDHEESSTLNAFHNIRKALLLDHPFDGSVSLFLQDPHSILMKSDKLNIPEGDILFQKNKTYTREQYLSHLDHLRALEKEYRNLHLHFSDNMPDNILLYVKDDVGIVMARKTDPKAVFLITERNIVSAFVDFFSNRYI